MPRIVGRMLVLGPLRSIVVRGNGRRVVETHNLEPGGRPLVIHILGNGLQHCCNYVSALSVTIRPVVCNYVVTILPMMCN